ncbi:MAG: carbohydrate kinase family protein [Syntrophorhabdales bacterium]
MIDVYGIGALNLDFIYEVAHLRDVDVPGLKLAHGGEIAGSDAQFSAFRRAVERVGVLKKVSPGGSASNTCHALFLMGYHVGLAGVVGHDGPGDTYLEQVEGVDTGSVVRKGRTGLAYIMISEERDRSIVVFPGSAADLLDADLDPEKLAAARWIHMASFVSPRGLETQVKLKRELQGRVAFSIDPGEIYAARGSEMFPLLAGTDVLFTSKREIELLFGCGQDQAIGQALAFAKTIVLKQGKEGASLFIKGFSCHVETGAVEAVDNTGAGDVLNGVFLGLLLRGIDPALALRVAVAAATSSVKAYGRDAYPDGQRIEVLYEDMLVHYGKGF